MLLAYDEYTGPIPRLFKVEFFGEHNLCLILRMDAKSPQKFPQGKKGKFSNIIKLFMSSYNVDLFVIEKVCTVHRKYRVAETFFSTVSICCAVCVCVGTENFMTSIYLYYLCTVENLFPFYIHNCMYYEYYAMNKCIKI